MVESLLMDDRDFFWMIGLIEGEGCFQKGPPSAPNKPFIAVQMTDEDVICRLAKMWGLSYWNTKRYQSHHKPCFVVRITGNRAANLMTQMRPHMSVRRQLQIDMALSTYTGINPKSVPRLDTTEIKRLRAAGMTFRAIAKSIGCHHSAISFHLKRKMPD